jgi:3-oxoacyl-(acyl-carrier-protein) synthase
MVRVMRQALAHSEVSSQAVQVVDAMGACSPIGDADEARAIQRVFGASLDGMRVTAGKAVLGYSAQVASVLEVIADTCSFSDGIVPPVPTCERQEPGLELPVGREPLARSVDLIMKNAFGMGGHYGSLILAAKEVGA